MSNTIQLADYQNKEVVIGDITIGLKDKGRYFLNDAHKASDVYRKQPSRST